MRSMDLTNHLYSTNIPNLFTCHDIVIVPHKKVATLKIVCHLLPLRILLIPGLDLIPFS